MTPSDVIRKRLDERGIEHRDIAKDKDGNVLTAWSASALDGALVTARENPKADTDKLMITLGKRYLTPERAITETVGVRTCRAVVCNQSDCVHNRKYRCACTDLEIQDQECLTYRCRDIDYDEEEE